MVNEKVTVRTFGIGLAFPAFCFLLRLQSPLLSSTHRAIVFICLVSVVLKDVPLAAYDEAAGSLLPPFRGLARWTWFSLPHVWPRDDDLSRGQIEARVGRVKSESSFASEPSQWRSQTICILRRPVLLKLLELAVIGCG